MSEQISIFNIGDHSAELNGAMFQAKAESNLFDPKLKDAKDTKVCIIRPIPMVKNPLQSMVVKHYYALQDQAGTLMFDSRTTFNRPAENHYEFCPVSDLWSKLNRSNDPNVQARAAQLRRQTANYAYVQVVKFPGEEHLEGKIMPMRLPAAMTKLFAAMAQPSEQELALGAVPTQPFDIINGKNIKCTIVGKIVNGTLMREWKVEALQPSQLELPLGPNGANVPVTQLAQEDVVKFITDAQSEDLVERYGYHEPANDVKIRMKNLLRGLVMDIPALVAAVNEYFPELPSNEVAPQAAQPVPQPQVAQPAVPAYQSVDPMQAAAAQAEPQPQAAPSAPTDIQF